jgi:hypothetical protein
MWRFPVRVLAVAVTGIAVGLSQAGPALAGGPGKWTRIGITNSGFNQAGMLRTANGRLHVIWLKQNSATAFSYQATTISLAGRLLGTTTAVSHWGTLESDPRLVPFGGGVRLVFIGFRTTNPADFFSRGAVYTATSSSGSAWSLVHGSMSHHTVLNLGLAATTDAGGAPVAAFGLNNVLYFHQGVDPSAPAASPDGSITGQVGTGLENPALARDSRGSVWVAWFHLFGSGGYWVDKILPSKGAPLRAPGSGATTGNDPRQQVALAARGAGGVYLAYCSPTKTQRCAHIDLWKVGSARPMVVPGSGTGNAVRVALAAGPRGRLTVAWFDTGTSKIHVVRTNKAATRFGVPRTIPAPPKFILFNGLQVDGSSGRQDIIANVTLTTPPNPVEFWHTQVLIGLRLTARPARFRHGSGAKVTFTVTDAHDAVAGAHVSCLGKSGTTGSSGKVTLKFGRGLRAGSHVCTATRPGYAAGRTTIRIR